jgi:hypothetical protein
MGKFRNRASRINKHCPSMDQHGVSDRSGSAKQRMLRATEDNDRSRVGSGIVIGLDESDGSERPEQDNVPQRKCGIFGGAIGLRIYRGAAPEIRRSFDAHDINPILNDPDVFPFISVPGIEHIDATAYVADSRNILLAAEGGGLFFVWQEPGIYEVHNNWLKAYRGRRAIAGTIAAVRWMFTHTDCMTIYAKIPAFAKPVARLAEFIGGVRQFERKALWPTKDGLVDTSFWSFHYEDWIRKTPDVAESGRRFHVMLDAEFARHGKEKTERSDEDCLLRHAGALSETLFHQPEKAVVLFNLWARFAGYGGCALVAKDPIIIDSGDAVMQIIGDQEIRVLKCR